MVYIKLYIIHPQHSAHDLEDPGFSNTNCTNLGVSKNRGTPKTPQNDHFLVGKPMKTNGCWVPPFLETSISCLVCLSRTFFSRRGAFPREPRSEVEWLSDVAIAVGSRLNAMINLMATKINGGCLNGATRFQTSRVESLRLTFQSQHHFCLGFVEFRWIFNGLVVMKIN